MEAALTALAGWAKAKAASWLQRNWPKIAAAVLALVLAVAVLVTMTTVMLSGTSQVAAASNACTSLGYKIDPADYQPAPVGQVPTIPAGGAAPGFGPGETEQLAVAQAIVAAGHTAGVGRRGMIVAVATALQESGLRNLDHGDRDSQGAFQQRPSQGWGTPEQVRDPQFAALAFYGGPTSPHFNPTTGKASPGGLHEVAGWADLPVTVAAQRVQRSAFPDAYAKHEPRATTIVDGLLGGTGGAPSVPINAGGGAAPAFGSADDFRTAGVDIDAFCAANFQRVGGATPGGTIPPGRVIPSGQWTAPLQSPITSEFGMRLHPVFHEWRMHSGTDFRAAVGTPIAAPSAGVVESVEHRSGVGLQVIITHANGITTRHLHLSQALVLPGDPVDGGQIIALSGNTGTGTGAHYHLEVRINGAPVDPPEFFLGVGVDLRAWS